MESDLMRWCPILAAALIDNSDYAHDIRAAKLRAAKLRAACDEQCGMWQRCHPAIPQTSFVVSSPSPTDCEVATCPGM